MNPYLIVITIAGVGMGGWWLFNLLNQKDVPQGTKVISFLALFLSTSFGLLYWTVGPGRGPTAEVTRAPTVQKTEAQVAEIKRIEAKPVVVKGPTKAQIKVQTATDEATELRLQAQKQTVQEAAKESNSLVQDLIDQSK